VLEPLDQSREVGVEIALVIIERHPVNPRRGVPAQRPEAFAQVRLVEQPVHVAESRLRVASRPIRYSPQ
jgi:NaMN:DMB phosphoribosyltransferase